MIEKSPVDKQKFIKNLLFTSNARAAWEHILFSLKSTKDVKVLMPSYIGYTDREGSGVFDPVQNQNAQAEFYKLNEDLTIDINHFKESLKNKKFDCALIIHYFGFCRNNMQEIKKICQKNNVVLIEDCAHAFHLHDKDALVGNYGDFSFYSLHKYLPTNSGGVLKKNNDNSILKSLAIEKKIDIQDLEHYANSDYTEIAKKRRDNYSFYEKYICKHCDVQVMYELMPNDIPQTFPILIKNVLEINENDLISELAVNSIKNVIDYLQLDTEICETSENYNNKTKSGQERVLDICGIEKASQYINPIGGIELYSKKTFKENGIVLNFIKSKPIIYTQFDNDFSPWLSIIDVLMFNSVSEANKMVNQYELV